MTTKPVIHTSPGIIEEDSIRIDTLDNCARCGENHLFLTFRKLKNKAGKATHWCPCPTTHEPIMMHLAPEKKMRKK